MHQFMRSMWSYTQTPIHTYMHPNAQDVRAYITQTPRHVPMPLSIKVRFQSPSQTQTPACPFTSIVDQSESLGTVWVQKKNWAQFVSTNQNRGHKRGHNFLLAPIVRANRLCPRLLSIPVCSSRGFMAQKYPGLSMFSILLF